MIKNNSKSKVSPLTSHLSLLVTGGAGFIGSNFIHHILSKYDDYEVVCLDKLTYSGNKDNNIAWENDKRYRFVQGDICDLELVDSLMKDADIVVHFAAETHVDRSVLSAREFVMTNVIGTQTLLDSAKNHGTRFHHISTDEVFGELAPLENAFTEVTPYDPRSPYSASKAASDHLVRAYFHTHNLPITISNCTNNYGPYIYPEKLIPLTITNILEGKKATVYGKGEQIRDWLHVSDHCEAIDLILHKGKIGETYGVGGDNQPTNLEIVQKIVALLGKSEQESIEFIGDRPGHDFRYDIDYSKIKKELGWSPKMTLDQGLEHTVAWFKDHESWWKPLKDGSYEQYMKDHMSTK